MLGNQAEDALGCFAVLWRSWFSLALLRGYNVSIRVLMRVYTAILVSVFWNGNVLASSRANPSVPDFPQSSAGQVTEGAFSLTTHQGKNVTEGDFKGQFLLIYFGYSYCPEECPTGLEVMGSAIELLAEEGRSVQPLFITFDPARDSLDRLAASVSNFHPRLIGLTGSKAQTLDAANYFGVDVSATYKAEVPGSDYSMNHSVFTYLVGPDGKLRVMFKDGTSAQLMAQTIRRHLLK